MFSFSFAFGFHSWMISSFLLKLFFFRFGTAWLWVPITIPGWSVMIDAYWVWNTFGLGGMESPTLENSAHESTKTFYCWKHYIFKNLPQLSIQSSSLLYSPLNSLWNRPSTSPLNSLEKSVFRHFFAGASLLFYFH